MSTPGISVQRRVHLDWLTALRFFAAFGVLLAHLAAPLHAGRRTHDALVFGQFGVDFFFVLSGFVLAWSRKPGRSPQRFYWLRFARIWPLHAAVMLALFALGTRAPWHEVVLQALLLQQWNPTAVFTEGLNGVSWTLSVEAFFYALFPAVVVALVARRQKRLALVCLGLWVAHLALILFSHGVTGPVKDWLTFSNPAVRVPQFVTGIALALVAERWADRDRSPSRRGIRAAQAVSFLALAVCWAGYVLTGGGHLAYWTWILTPVMALLVGSFAIAGVSLGDAPPRALVTLGEWSFALYLVHRGLVYDHVFPHTSGWPVWLSTATAIVLSVALAGAAHEFFEKPVERWLRARGPRERTV